MLAFAGVSFDTQPPRALVWLWASPGLEGVQAHTPAVLNYTK